MAVLQSVQKTLYVRTSFLPSLPAKALTAQSHRASVRGVASIRQVRRCLRCHIELRTRKPASYEPGVTGQTAVSRSRMLPPGYLSGRGRAARLQEVRVAHRTPGQSGVLA